MARTFKLFAIVFLLTFLPLFVYAASLSISPANETIEVGDRITVKVVVTGNESINAISGELSVPMSIFSIESVSKFGSILNFWVTEPSFSNSSGRVNFEGVTLGGFQGVTGSVVTISLRARAEGTGKINFVSGQVLANDGQGTNVTQNLTGASFVVNEATQKKDPEPIAEPVQTLPASLEAPEIMLVYKYGEKAISGTSSYPHSSVVVSFINDEGVKVFVQGETDDSGQFLILVPKTLKRGFYKVSAQVAQKDLTYSPSSNVIKIKIGNLISDLGWEFRLIFIILLICIVYLSERVYLYLKRDKEIKREAHEAKEVIRKSFKLLHEDVDNSLSGKTGIQAKQEAKEIIKDLEDAETLIVKELKDIEKL